MMEKEQIFYNSSIKEISDGIFIKSKVIYSFLV